MDCSICLGDLAKGPLDVTRCGHPFHRHCLLQSLEFKKECPLCKAVVRESQCQPLFLSFTRANGAEEVTQGVDVDELRETIGRLEQERRELLDFKKRAKPKLSEHERMVAELKVLANTYKRQQEDCRAAEMMVVDLQRKLLEQRRELEQLQTIVHLHKIRNAGGDLPADVALSTPQQKDEYIRNQRQLLAWATGDVKELQAEKKALARQRDLLEEQVQALSKKLRAATREGSRAPLRDGTNKRRRGPGSPAKPWRPPEAGAGEPLRAVASDVSLTPEEVFPPTSSLLVPQPHDPRRPTAALASEANDHSVIEVMDSSMDAADDPAPAPAPNPGALPAAPPPPPASQPAAAPSNRLALPRCSRSFLAASPAAALPFGPSLLAQRGTPAFSAVHPVLTPPERTHQTTLKGLLKR